MDLSGAETLVGRGDMLYMSPQNTTPERMQGTFTPDSTLDRVINQCESYTDVERREIQIETEIVEPVVQKTLEEQLKDRVIRSKEIASSVQQYIEMEEEISSDVEVEEVVEVKPVEAIETVEVVVQKPSKVQKFFSGCAVWAGTIAICIVIVYFLGEVLIS